MTIYEAGMDILYLLMSIDNEIAETEVEEMMKYLIKCGNELGDGISERPSLPILIMEIGLLGELDREKLLRRWYTSVNYFAENTSPEQLGKMFEFALDMIAADGKIVPEERKYFTILGEAWEMDSASLIEGKSKELENNSTESSNAN